jgi:hypothetical protein
LPFKCNLQRYNAVSARTKIVESSSHLDSASDAEDKCLREDLRARLTERDEIFEEERRMTGTYQVIASRLAKTKKEEGARNAVGLCTLNQVDP